MMKLFRRFLALLFSAALSLTVAVYILSHTLGNAAFIQTHAAQTQLYQKMAEHLPGVSAADLEQQLQTLVPQISNFISQGTAAPVIDIPGVTTVPITLGQPNPTLSGIIKIISQLGFIAPLAAVAMAVIILAIGRRSRWHILAAGALQAAISVAVMGGLLWLAPGLVMQNFAAADLLIFKAAVTDFVIAIFHDTAWQFLYAAAGLAGLALLLWFAAGAARFRERFPRRPKFQSESPDPANPSRVARS